MNNEKWEIINEMVAAKGLHWENKVRNDRILLK
jgi:hypothetical protein